MANFNDWYNASLGHQIDIDGAYGDQCVDVALSWAQFCFPGHGWPELLGHGNAKDLYGASNGNYFDKLQGIIPQQGDMVVFGATATNPYGHIAVVISADGSHMNVIEQNGFNPSGVAYTAQRPYNNIVGFLRPKGQEEMIQDSDNEYSRWDKVATQIRGRHRGFTRDEFRSAAVGRTWLQALEILSDDPESDQYYSDSNLSADDLNNLMGELGVPIPPNPNDIEYHINQQDGHWKTSFYDLIQRKDRVRIPDLNKIIEGLKAQIAKGGGTLDPKVQAQLDKIDQNTVATKGLVQKIIDLLLSKFSFSKKK